MQSWGRRSRDRARAESAGAVRRPPRRARARACCPRPPPRPSAAAAHGAGRRCRSARRRRDRVRGAAARAPRSSGSSTSGAPVSSTSTAFPTSGPHPSTSASRSRSRTPGAPRASAARLRPARPAGRGDLGRRAALVPVRQHAAARLAVPGPRAHRPRQEGRRARHDGHPGHGPRRGPATSSPAGTHLPLLGAGRRRPEEPSDSAARSCSGSTGRSRSGWKAISPGEALRIAGSFR